MYICSCLLFKGLFVVNYLDWKIVGEFGYEDGGSGWIMCLFDW